MKVTIESFDHCCTQPEGQDCGEVIERGEGATKIRKYVIRGDGRKLPKLFKSKESALAEAIKLGYEVV